jgi:hypothetical protein
MEFLAGELGVRLGPDMDFYKLVLSYMESLEEEAPAFDQVVEVYRCMARLPITAEGNEHLR